MRIFHLTGFARAPCTTDKARPVVIVFPATARLSVAQNKLATFLFIKVTRPAI